MCHNLQPETPHSTLLSGSSLLMTQWTAGTVVDIKHWTNNLFSVQIDADILPFEAGQYTHLALDLDNSQTGQPYSICSAPGEPTLEFFLYSQTPGDSAHKLSTLRSGDLIWVNRQAQGIMTLGGVKPSATLCLLATGTGVAPFLSMLKSTDTWSRFNTIILVYAVRVRDDFRYSEVFDRLREQYPDRFTLLPVISREQVPATIHGHIPASLSSGELEQQAGMAFSPHNSHFMLCGNPGMVKDAVAVLQARGFKKHTVASPGQLSFESYW
jgi:ferredoxin/flavodoxin---NADP+ reductase